MLKLTKEGTTDAFDWEVLEKGYKTQVKQDAACFMHISDFSNLTNEGAQANTGVWLDAEDDLDEVSSNLLQVPAIAINFPIFADGRGFSIAQQLRMEKGYKGEIYAIGHFMEEQLFYLKRCGFDAFVIQHDTDVEPLKAILNDFSNNYQGSPIEARPLFKRRT